MGAIDAAMRAINVLAIFAGRIMSIRFKFIAAVVILAFAVSHAVAMLHIGSAARNTTASVVPLSGD
jgi:hypothetical protein